MGKIPIETTQFTSLKLLRQHSSAAPPVYFAADPQTLAMAGAEKALVMTAGATLQVTSNIIYADPGGADADLLLPPEADCEGLWLMIVNTADAAESIAVKEDGDATVIANLGQGIAGYFVCDGTTWKGGALMDGSVAGAASPVVCAGVSFTEDGSTTLTGTVEIPAGATLLNIQVVITVLFDDTGAVTLKVGDDDVADGWFTGVDAKATDLLVGEVLDISNAENWGAAQGAYLVAASGRKGRTTAGVDSGIYYGDASEVIGVITTTNQDGTAGRAFMFVTYAKPTVVAATGA
jgi:hypothetical protein